MRKRDNLMKLDHKRGKKKPRGGGLPCYYCEEMWKYKKICQRKSLGIERESQRCRGEGGNLKEQIATPKSDSLRDRSLSVKKRDSPSIEFSGF